MNTKLNLTLIVITILFAASACSPAVHSSTNSSPVSNIAQRADKTVALVAVTGGHASVSVQETQAYPNQQFHRYCVSEDSRRQANCMEPKPGLTSGLISSGTSTDIGDYPSQQLHSACVSQDKQRQDSCIP